MRGDQVTFPSACEADCRCAGTTTPGACAHSAAAGGSAPEPSGVGAESRKPTAIGKNCGELALTSCKAAASCAAAFVVHLKAFVCICSRGGPAAAVQALLHELAKQKGAASWHGLKTSRHPAYEACVFSKTDLFHSACSLPV